MGRERSLVATSIRLLKLPDDIQKLIEEEKLSAGHGRALLMNDDATEQRRIARKVIDEGLSVRETERTVKRAGEKSQSVENKKVPPSKDPNVAAAETKLMRRLGTNVKIVPKGNGKAGRLEIEYYSTEDLDRIYEMLMNQ